MHDDQFLTTIIAPPSQIQHLLDFSWAQMLTFPSSLFAHYYCSLFWGFLCSNYYSSLQTILAPPFQKWHIHVQQLCQIESPIGNTIKMLNPDTINKVNAKIQDKARPGFFLFPYLILVKFLADWPWAQSNLNKETSWRWLWTWGHQG